MTAPEGETLGSQRTRRPLQFSVRGLMAGAVALCLAFSMWAWGGDAMTYAPEFFLALGACLILVGVLLRRHILTVAGAVVLMAFSLALYNQYQHVERSAGLAEYRVWRCEQVTVTVVDAATKKPIPQASVRLVTEEGSLTRASNARTDSQGTAEISAWLVCAPASTAYGFESFTRGESGGHVFESFTRVNVRAAGYETLRAPLFTLPFRSRLLWPETAEDSSLIIELQRE